MMYLKLNSLTDSIQKWRLHFFSESIKTSSFWTSESFFADGRWWLDFFFSFFLHRLTLKEHDNSEGGGGQWKMPYAQSHSGLPLTADWNYISLIANIFQRLFDCKNV